MHYLFIRNFKNQEQNTKKSKNKAISGLAIEKSPLKIFLQKLFSCGIPTNLRVLYNLV